VRSESVPHRSCSYRSQGEPHYQPASGGCAPISSFSSPTDRESKSNCLSLLAATHQPDGRAVARVLRLMLVGFLLVFTVTQASCAAGCKTCNPADQTCTACTDTSHNIQVDGKSCATGCPQNSAPNNQKVCVCEGGYGPVAGENRCKQNPSAGCAAGCKTCNPADQTCTACTDTSHNIQVDGKSCKANCPEHAAASSNVCGCSTGYSPVAGQNKCEKASNTQCNTPNCKACDNPKTDNEICTECNDNNYLTPTNQCIPDCTTISGYYGDTDKKCKACNPECAECVGPASNQCSSCPAGKALTYGGSDPAQGGTCGDACTADKNGCKVCGARIGGTDYCSQCSVGTQAPLNGVCTANARAQFCTQVTGGSCTSCSGGYFLKDGGCYQADRQPGKQICTLADSKGGCQTCANGLPPSSSDVCPSCHSTCKTCSTADTANTCTTCATGYYMIGSGPNTCISCDSNSGSVKGVAGCMSCAPPSSGTGSVLCYLIKDSGSTNRGGLSTGAIAGIAVAAVVVVGGLVGFLCWWFLCRGKA
ncbi:Variant-specific surface protein, partial [Giardia duodenalis]